MSEWDYDDRPELPPEAGNKDVLEFDPDDGWLKSAPKELQIEAMRLWFYARFEDPANCTPYDSGEGGYQFIFGGPYDPNDEIQERFSEVVDYKVMEELIEDLYQECGDEWASANHGGWDYDDIYSMLPEDRSDPFRMLNVRLGQIEETISDVSPSGFVTQLLHSATITALESYLWDTTAYWVTHDRQLLRSFVKANTDFANEKFKLSDVFLVMDDLEKKVIEYLQAFIWHRLDKAKPLLEITLKIKFPDISEFIQEINIRHDIVHRGGRNKEGRPVRVSVEDVRRVSKLVGEFAKSMEAEIERVFPYAPIPSKF
ncbi:hypothetical protein K9857_04865 [Pseudomonas sp. REP124]|uniref:hypothetical protein n=1 Tax=Pseudomonas sp. REP124 TaxID=2875731 RepID=UPI001CCF5B16|nr:hypothetical protein [Pseudomonas sp. REP124]MBZ9780881.1 hypothetical protein [Pseudomonas sp. REP124]